MKNVSGAKCDTAIHFKTCIDEQPCQISHIYWENQHENEHIYVQYKAKITNICNMQYKAKTTNICN